MKKDLVLIGILTIVSSLVTFYTSNLFLSDVANMAVDLNGLITSFSGLIVAFELIVAVMILIKKMNGKTDFYWFIFAIMQFSFFGLILSLVTGFVVYGSFLLPYPFYGYIFLCVFIHTAVLVCSVVYVLKHHKGNKLGILDTLRSCHLFLFIFLVFNRFGSFLLSVTYMSIYTVYKSIPVYLTLLILLSLFVYYVLDNMKDKFMTVHKAFIYLMVTTLVAVAQYVIILIMGINDTQFISSVSMFLGLERLAGMPVEYLFYLLFTFGTIAAFVARKYREKQKQVEVFKI